MAALTSKILTNTLHFWRKFLFTSLPTWPRLQLSRLCSPCLTLTALCSLWFLWLLVFLPGSIFGVFCCSLASLLVLSFKALLLLKVSWKLWWAYYPLPWSIIDRYLGAYCSLICISHSSCGKPSRYPCQLPREHLLSDVPQSTSHSLFLQYWASHHVCPLCFISQRKAFPSYSRRNLGIPETLLNLHSTRWQQSVSQPHGFQLLRISRLPFCPFSHSLDQNSPMACLILSTTG